MLNPPERNRQRDMVVKDAASCSQCRLVNRVDKMRLVAMPSFLVLPTVTPADWPDGILMSGHLAFWGLLFAASIAIEMLSYVLDNFCC